MKKPINLRQETWDFLLSSISTLTENQLKQLVKKLGYSIKENESKELIIENLAEDPAPILYHLGIFNLPNLLKQTVIEMENGVDYLLTEKVAKSLAEGELEVVLSTLYNPVRERYKTEEITRAFKNHRTFDQLE